MRKGKRFLENENVIIYVGTAVFVALAIAVGIVMYMTTKINNQNNGGQLINENANIGKNIDNDDNIQNVSSNLGKTVEEQENNANLVSKTEETNNQNKSKTENSVNSENTSTTNTKTQKETSSTNNITENTQNSSVLNSSTNTQKVTETKNEISFEKPTDGEIISEFAQENLIYSETLKEWITHTGIDIKADKTSVIKAAANGVISSIINDPRYGLTVVITHDDGYQTVYSNLLTAEFVVEGEEVKQGQTIGTAGNTASFESNMECHLHFEILKDGNYLNPSIYLK